VTGGGPEVAYLDRQPNGLARGADVRIEGDSVRLVGLSTVPIRLGLPDLTRKEGRAVIRDLIAGRLRIRGLMAHPGKLARLSKLLSVS
jgi:hypothetical protein